MNLAVEFVPSAPAEATVAHGHTPGLFGAGESTVASGPKFAPNHLISEGSDGEPVFAEAAFRASGRSREQARLFYEQGVKETRLVNARRWREVQCQYSPDEISKAEEVMVGLETIRKQNTLCKVLEREERSTVPNPFLLKSLDSRLQSLRPGVEAVRELMASASEREFALVKVLEQLRKEGPEGTRLETESTAAACLRSVRDAVRRGEVRAGLFSAFSLPQSLLSSLRAFCPSEVSR
jgi:hypothetical protein